MARSRETKIELTAYDDLFQTEESREEAKLSKIRDIPISEIDEFPDHPFKVLMDEDIEGFTADMEKYAKNKPEDKEQFFMQVGGKPYTDKKEAGTAIIAMCKEIKGINASADVGEYLGFKLNVTFDSFNNKFVMNVKGAMSHPMEVGSDAIRNITRINNVLEAISDEEYAGLVLEAAE